MAAAALLAEIELKVVDDAPIGNRPGLPRTVALQQSMFDGARMSTSDIARIVHRLPKRVRLRVAARRGDSDFFGDATEALRGLAGITRIASNQLTGSFVIEYDPTVSGGFDEIAKTARRKGIFRIAASGARGNGYGAAIPARPLDITAASFAGLGLYQISQGQVAGNAVDNLWNAYGATVTLNQPLVTALLLGLGLYQVANGQLLGSASSLLFYALSARHMARTGDPEGRVEYHVVTGPSSQSVSLRQ